MRVGGAVFEHHAHAGGALAAGLLERAALHGAAQLHHVASRLREVDVHGVDLLNDGQRCRFALPHQRTFGDQCAPDAARDRRRHIGVVQGDAPGLHGGLASGHIGLGLLLRGHRIGIFLLAHCVGGQQWFVALGQPGSLRQVGLCAGETGLRRLQGCRIGSGVNHKQALACLDVAAFTEQAFLHNARRASTHLRHTRSLQAPWQLGDQTDIAGLHGHHPNLRWRHAATRRGRRCLAFATGGQ